MVLFHRVNLGNPFPSRAGRREGVLTSLFYIFLESFLYGLEYLDELFCGINEAFLFPSQQPLWERRLVFSSLLSTRAGKRGYFDTVFIVMDKLTFSFLPRNRHCWACFKERWTFIFPISSSRVWEREHCNARLYRTKQSVFLASLFVCLVICRVCFQKRKYYPSYHSHQRSSTV